MAASKETMENNMAEGYFLSGDTFSAFTMKKNEIYLIYQLKRIVILLKVTSIKPLEIFFCANLLS